MKKEPWHDRIRRDLAHDPLRPAADDFYEKVWNRIRAVKSAEPAKPPIRPLFAVGQACWKAMPAAVALTLAFSIYLWSNFPDWSKIDLPANSSLLEAEEAPTHNDVLYQILNSPEVPQTETTQ
jgi:hypothetical protein